ncbi:MAG: hypothetical protein ABSF35_22005 [Polyangia bacterium]
MQIDKSTRQRSDGGDAFIPESAQISGTPDDLAEFSGEQYLREAVDNDIGEGSRDEELTEELGGPFVESRPEEEFGPTWEGRGACDVKIGSEKAPTAPSRSPLPQAVGPLAIAAPDEDGQGEVAEEDRNGRPLAASDVRAANLGAEPGSTMEPDIKLDPLASHASGT